MSKAESLRISGPALQEMMRQVLEKGVPFQFQAQGASMFPFIRDGDVLRVSPVGERLVVLGDVLAFRCASGRLAVHRVVWMKNGRFLMRGDCNPGPPDGWVSREQLLGKVTLVTRRGKPVAFGLGSEKALIALASLCRILPTASRLALSILALKNRIVE